SDSGRPARALAAAGVRPSKSRGQNFLVQTAVANRIVDAAQLARGDSVLEIGPGLGILTERIASHPIARRTLGELDRALAERLERIFAGDRRVQIVNSDFLDFDLSAIVNESRLKIVGNLPFSSAAAILHRLCDNARIVDRMVLMFQREVGERIRARPGSSAYSALTVFTALYFEIESYFRVAAGNFHPKPRVDAEVLTLKPRAEPMFAPRDERTVLATVRAPFSAPRKTIRNSLAHGLAIGTLEV